MISRPVEKLRRLITRLGKKLIHSLGTAIIRPRLTKSAGFPSVNPAEPRILYVALAYRGDLILSLPAIGAIRKKYPTCQITCWVRGYNLSLARVCPDISDVITYDSFHSGGLAVLWDLIMIRRHRAFIRALRARRFDLMIDDSGTGFTAMAGAIARIPLRIGRDTQGYGFLYHTEFPYAETEHLVEKRLRLLSSIGIESKHADPIRIELDRSLQDKVRAKIGLRTGEQYFTVQTLSGWEAKNWQDCKVIAVVNCFAQETGLTPVFVGGQGDRERIDRMNERSECRSISGAGLLELDETFALISNAQIHFGVDSVGAHMAAAAGVKSVTLFGPTNPLLSAALSNKHIVVFRRIACSPAKDQQYCALDGGRLCPRFLCMESLDVQSVLTVLLKHFKGSNQGPMVNV